MITTTHATTTVGDTNSLVVDFICVVCLSCVVSSMLLSLIDDNIVVLNWTSGQGGLEYLLTKHFFCGCTVPWII